MLGTVLIAANMCLQGGERIDISRYVESDCEPSGTQGDPGAHNRNPGGLLAGL
jgi:hypothetical protein